jgi:hypothetical protein
MNTSFTATEIENRLNQIKATTSVWVPMGYYIMIKILLHRKKEKFSSLVMKAVINELEKQPMRNDETFTREEVIYELRSLKKAPSRIRAAERLGINPAEIHSGDESFGQGIMFSKIPTSNFMREVREEKKEEVRTKREIDLYFMQTLKQLSDRLEEIEKRQIDSSEKTEES